MRGWAAAGGLGLLALAVVCLAAQRRAVLRTELLLRRVSLDAAAEAQRAADPPVNWWSRVVSNSAAQVIMIPVFPATCARRRCPPCALWLTPLPPLTPRLLPVSPPRHHAGPLAAPQAAADPGGRVAPGPGDA